MILLDGTEILLLVMIRSTFSFFGEIESQGLRFGILGLVRNGIENIRDLFTIIIITIDIDLLPKTSNIRSHASRQSFLVKVPTPLPPMSSPDPTHRRGTSAEITSSLSLSLSFSYLSSLTEATFPSSQATIPTAISMQAKRSGRVP